MTLQEFKSSIEACIQKAKEGGLSEEEIFCEFLEQVRFMTVKQSVKLLAQKERSPK